jgi:hypothetical protein
VITSSTDPLLNPGNYWVCVVVVEVAGTAGTAGVVVVVLVVVVGGGVAQPDSDDAMTTAAKQAMISFFISMIFVCLVVLPARNYAIGWSPAMGCNPTWHQAPPNGGGRRPNLWAAGAESAHDKDDQANQQNQAKPAAADDRPAKVKSAAAKQEEKNQHE